MSTSAILLFASLRTSRCRIRPTESGGIYSAVDLKSAGRPRWQSPAGAGCMQPALLYKTLSNSHYYSTFFNIQFLHFQFAVPPQISAGLTAAPPIFTAAGTAPEEGPETRPHVTSLHHAQPSSMPGDAQQVLLFNRAKALFTKRMAEGLPILSPGAPRVCKAQHHEWHISHHEPASIPDASAYLAYHGQVGITPVDGPCLLVHW